MRREKTKLKTRVGMLCMAAMMLGNSTTTALAASNAELAEARKTETVQSNEVENWPQGPAIGAEGAILMDADTGAILYAKNIHEQLYPASVTKIMTCLLAAENTELTDEVTFSKNAVYSVPSDGCNMGMDTGETITMEQCLNGILVHSANEVANAVAEYIGGSIDGFADMMNERAAELGCTDTHFTNPSGLFDENHYTSAYDLALMATEMFKYEDLCEMASKHSYTVDSTNLRPEGFTVYSKNKFFNGQYPYEYVVGSKTGYTNEARQTLVTCAEKDGMRLICVILKEESPYQFEDTINLFNYGFDNFSHYSVSEDSNVYETDSSQFIDPLEETLQIVDSDAIITLPNGVDFSQTEVSYESDLNIVVTESYDADSTEDNAALSTANTQKTVDGIDVESGTLTYTYNGVTLGSVSVTGQNLVLPEAEEEEKSSAESVKETVQEFGIWAGAILVFLLIIAVGAGWFFKNKVKKS